MLLSPIIFSESVAARNPSEQDLNDALEMAIESYPEELEGKSIEDFDLKYLGKLKVFQLAKYADLSSWLESIDTEEEMRSFRGDKWFERMEKFYQEGSIPPIVVVQGENFVDIGDGRGRVNYANWKGIPLTVWMLKLKKKTPQEKALQKNTDLVKKLIGIRNENGINNMLHHAEKTFGLKKTGEGMYKVVFSLGPNRVLKIAKSGPGFGDLKQEEESYKCAPDFFPKVYASGPGWAIVERIKNTFKTKKYGIESDIAMFFDIDYKKLSELAQRNFQRFYQVINLVKEYRINKMFDSYKEAYEYLFSKPNFVKFLRAVKACGLNLSDMHMNNYGINNAGHFVIIDSQGGTEDYGDFSLSEQQKNGA
jgi:hypothetical protein